MRNGEFLEWCEKVGSIQSWTRLSGWAHVITPEGDDVEVLDLPGGPVVVPVGTVNVMLGFLRHEGLLPE